MCVTHRHCCDIVCSKRVAAHKSNSYASVFCHYTHINTRFLRAQFPSTVGNPFSIWSRLLHNRAKNVIKKIQIPKMGLKKSKNATQYHANGHAQCRLYSTDWIVLLSNRLAIHLANIHKIKVQHFQPLVKPNTHTHTYTVNEDKRIIEFFKQFDDRHPPREKKLKSQLFSMVCEHIEYTHLNTFIYSNQR